MSLPLPKNISIYKGDSFFFVFRVRERDEQGAPAGLANLTGATVKSQIRATEDSDSVITEFAVSHNGVGGEVTLSLTPTVTAGLTSGGVWDVQITWPDTTVRTYLKGTVSLVKEVTRLA